MVYRWGPAATLVSTAAAAALALWWADKGTWTSRLLVSYAGASRLYDFFFPLLGQTRTVPDTLNHSVSQGVRTKTKNLNRSWLRNSLALRDGTPDELTCGAAQSCVAD